MTTPCDSDALMIIPTAGVAMAAEAVEEEKGLPLLAHFSLRKAYERECACFGEVHDTSSNAADLFDSEMFEWTQRACSPELFPCPSKMQVADDENDRVQQISIRRCEGTKRSLQHQKVSQIQKQANRDTPTELSPTNLPTDDNQKASASRNKSRKLARKAKSSDRELKSNRKTENQKWRGKKKSQKQSPENQLRELDPVKVEIRVTSGDSIIFSPRFKSVAAMTGWDEESLLLGSLVADDTAERDFKYMKLSVLDSKTPPTNSSRRAMDGQCRMETERPLKKPNFIEDEDGKLILVPPPPEELYSCGKLYYVLESHFNAIKAGMYL
ncbi:hypothetical protein FF1_027608 [Malus domestica]